MLFFRAKAKVRYSLILVTLTSVFLYLLLKHETHTKQSPSELSRDFKIKQIPYAERITNRELLKKGKTISQRTRAEMSAHRPIFVEPDRTEQPFEKNNYLHNEEYERSIPDRSIVIPTDHEMHVEGRTRDRMSAASNNEKVTVFPNFDEERITESVEDDNSPTVDEKDLIENDSVLHSDDRQRNDVSVGGKQEESVAKTNLRHNTFDKASKKQVHNEETHYWKLAEKIDLTNISIFDPDDSEITYFQQIQDSEEFFHSQVNKSRISLPSWTNRLPMTPEDAIFQFGSQLPYWERYEIQHFPKVYYLGLNANKSRIQNNKTNNYGFDHDEGTIDVEDDDQEGHYRVHIGDHIGYRYEIIKYLGSGTFGMVLLARDWSKPTLRDVALKIMHLDEKEKYFTREVDLLTLIERNASHREYFSRILSTFKFRNHHCMTLELLGESIHRSKRKYVIHDYDMLRRYANDMIHAMLYLHELGIVHGDLKPANMMFIYDKTNKSEGQLLKIADFGIGCIPPKKEWKCQSYYLQSLVYRAPEVILGLPITTKVDMYSVGVILAEFYLNEFPFHGGTEISHLASVMEILGLPPTYMIAKSKRQRIYTKALCYTTKDGFHRRPFRKPLFKLLRGMHPALFDLIARCLEWDPRFRITAKDALRHPFMTGSYPAIDLEKPLVIKRFLGEI